MTVRIAAYGSLRGAPGLGTTGTLTVAPGTTLDQALDGCGFDRATRGRTVAVAVNGVLVRGDRELAEGDAIDLLPPVSGG